MKIKEFGVEIWMNDYENTCRYNLAETCVESLTVEQLLEMSGKRDTILNELLPMKLTYGAIEGSDRLRDNIISLYQKQKRDNILITHGAIGANALVHETLVSPGDRVIAVLPTYQQHYSIPESYGADVHIVKLKEENQFLPDLDELRQLATEGTRLIAINNPNNPTGALMDEAFLEQVVDIARSCGAYLLCDEVYRGTDEEGNGFTASVADLYEKGIGTSSMSKTFSLAGLRLGWLAGPLEVIKAVCIHRDYNTISVGMLDDHFASIALECRDAILERNRNICNTNRDMLDAWVAKEPLISYIRPKSGTTALLKYDLDMSSRDFCIGLLEAKGVMFTPGSVLDMEGYVRIGYANNPQVLETGLAKVSEYLAELQG
ncbi:aminotransferase [Photobacterium sp. OFAV2-7]|uniref:aminotransferase n=1 Tax=Photobacterium sp. OFAV2-7 TaxID=2917748 RepID=UPI001EF3E552|nr:aminotransferase [Photobacterium sp. OFAV2-7]MCG7587085.1 aminotransferase [Photobacterium sp. OFAV2-7]